MTWGASASHVPVLVAMAIEYEPRNVLEIGSGELSTNLFLDKKIFTDLTNLVVVEDDPVWAAKLPKDNRLEARTTVPVSLYNYDLIFIDGPQDSTKREKTIRFVMRELIDAIIVIHDAEYPPYKSAINKLYNIYNFSFISPNTIVANRNPINKIKYKKYNTLLKKEFDGVQEDWVTWKHLLQLK